jgi:dolichyl-phosphate-mannose-protein mannosyltransferase
MLLLGYFSCPILLILYHSLSEYDAFLIDNSLVTQSRLILLDSMLLLFTFTPIYAWIRFYKLRFQPFSNAWWLWLSLTGVGLAFALGVKIGMGLFTLALIGVATLVDLWRLLDIKRGVPDVTILLLFSL